MFKFFKPKLPFNFKFRLRNPFQRRVKRLYRIWKRFLAQIPPIFRRTIQSYDNFFIVLGDAQSGKSQLIRKYIEKEQDVYSFETMYTAEPEAQFYIGSKYVVGELSWPFIEDRSIETRKELIHLFEHLFSHRNPTCVVSYNPTYWARQDGERVEQHARLLLNKLSLLTHITNKPVKVRIALTHLDKIRGYLEFTRAMQACGGSFELSLSAYETANLKETLQSYEHYLTFILKTGSAKEYINALNFFKELPELFSTIDRFIRATMQKGTEKRAIVLERLFFTSSHQSDLTALFACKQSVSPSVFIRRHILKHQVTCLALLLLSASYIGGRYLFESRQLKEMSRGITTLERYQSQDSLDQILPVLYRLPKKDPCDRSLLLLPSFFYPSYSKLSKEFIEYSTKYILLPKLKKTLSEGNSEIKTMYSLGMLCATNTNKLGQLILENSQEWSNVLNLPRNFIDFHIRLCSQPLTKEIKSLESHFNLYFNTALTSCQPWVLFLEQLSEIIARPSLIESSIKEVKEEAKRLLSDLDKLKKHRLTPHVCKLLMEEGIPEVQDIFYKKVDTFQRLKGYSESLYDLLSYIQKTSLDLPSLCDCNLTTFLSRIQDLLSSNEAERPPYSYNLDERDLPFEAKNWESLIVAYQAKHLIQDYISHNRESEGGVFFKNALTTPDDISLSYLEEDFPQFKGETKIPGLYTLNAYETNIHSICNKLSRINDSKLIEIELRSQITKFISHDVEAYAKQYRRFYQGLFQRFDCAPTSLEEAKKLAFHLSESSSHFITFLHSLKQNLTLPSTDLPVLQPMKHLSEFQFLNILIDDINNPAEFANYQEILKEMLDELSDKESTCLKEGVGLLERLLTAPSKISLAILTHSPDSYHARVTNWLQKSEVPLRYHPFFLNPILWVHTHGIKSLKAEIEQGFVEEAEALITPLLSKFPFDFNATPCASVAEVEETLHMKSRFWEVIQELLGGVSVQKGGKFEPSHPATLNLNPRLYNLVNRLAEIRDLLWDRQGERQPITLKVQTVLSQPLPDSRKRITYSYLLTGDVSLFNINQAPQWEDLNISWWKKDSSHIGAEVIDSKGKNPKLYDAKKIINENWSFFKFLKEGRTEDETMWTWKVTELALQDEEEVSLYFENAPHKLLEPRI